MKRTTIFIPEALERELQMFASRAGKPVASVVREAVAAYIVETSDGGVLPSFTGAFDSGHTDTAERHDELLFRRVVPHDTPARTARTAGGRRRATVRRTTPRRKKR
jgi:hypothetical protein